MNQSKVLLLNYSSKQKESARVVIFLSPTSCSAFSSGLLDPFPAEPGQKGVAFVSVNPLRGSGEVLNGHILPRIQVHLWGQGECCPMLFRAGTIHELFAEFGFRVSSASTCFTHHSKRKSWTICSQIWTTSKAWFCWTFCLFWWFEPYCGSTFIYLFINPWAIILICPVLPSPIRYLKDCISHTLQESKTKLKFSRNKKVKTVLLQFWKNETWLIHLPSGWSGENMMRELWAEGESDHMNGDCVLLHGPGHLMVNDCDSALYFICEFYA